MQRADPRSGYAGSVSRPSRLDVPEPLLPQTPEAPRGTEGHELSCPCCRVWWGVRFLHAAPALLCAEVSLPECTAKASHLGGLVPWASEAGGPEKVAGELRVWRGHGKGQTGGS